MTLYIALLMIMLALFGVYFTLRIEQSYKFFRAPIFCVCYAAVCTGCLHFAANLSRNEDLYFLVSFSVVLFWFGRANYAKSIKLAEDIFDFQEVGENEYRK